MRPLSQVGDSGQSASPQEEPSSTSLPSPLLTVTGWPCYLRTRARTQQGSGVPRSRPPSCTCPVWAWAVLPGLQSELVLQGSRDGLRPGPRGICVAGPCTGLQQPSWSRWGLCVWCWTCRWRWAHCPAGLQFIFAAPVMEPKAGCSFPAGLGVQLRAPGSPADTRDSCVLW